MSQQIIINSGLREKRAAILVDNVLENIFFEQDTYKKIAGNIYRGRVKNIFPGMQAAFVDIGINKNAFLHISDLYPLFSEEQQDLWQKNKLGIHHVIQPGQELMVQVVKEPIGTKGPKISCKITIPGRFFVLIPLDRRINISRKITDNDARKRLISITNKLTNGKTGLIIRTNALNKDEEELGLDFNYLLHLWKEINKKYKHSTAKELIYQNVDLIQQLIRDYFSADIDKLVVDSKDDYSCIIELVEKTTPYLKNKVYLYEKTTPIFTTYGIENQLLKAFKRKVWLDSGGYIVFDKTEALVAIDVNTGKYTGKKNLQDTVFRTNLEAAKEIAKQLRLRDIGGIIIIDFIDMNIKENQEKVLETLEEELSKDRTKTAILGLTKLGLVEMTRKKVREVLEELIQMECPYCHGTGKVLSEGTMALKIIREITVLTLKEGFSAILLELHPKVAAVLIGSGGENLAELEKELNIDIYICGNDELHIEEFNILNKGSKEELRNLSLPVKKNKKYQLKIEEKQSNNPQDGIARIKGFIIIIKDGGHLVGQDVNIEIEEIFRTFAKGKIVS